MLSLSIVTINLNNRLGLERTIQSIISQTNRNFEFIVIDGASSDGSIELIERYSDNIDIKVVENDFGIYNAMNKGIRLASNEYLLFLNSADTLVSENTIDEVFNWLDGTDIVVGLTEYEGENERKKLTKLPATVCDLNYLIKASLPHQSTFIRRELLSNGYDESLKIVSDWKFFVEAICINKCSIKAINLVVAKFDMTGISTNSDNYKQLDSEKKQVLWELFRYDFSDWRKDHGRILTADYYEKLTVMKVYFLFKSVLRKLGLLVKKIAI